MQIVPGSIVRSGAGRDRERFYVVLAVENGFALIADGKVRRVEHPKRKNLCHLHATTQTVALSDADTNPKLRRLLQSWNQPVAVVKE